MFTGENATSELFALSDHKRLAGVWTRNIEKGSFFSTYNVSYRVFARQSPPFPDEWLHEMCLVIQTQWIAELITSRYGAKVSIPSLPAN